LVQIKKTCSQNRRVSVESPVAHALLFLGAFLFFSWTNPVKLKHHKSKARPRFPTWNLV